MFNFLKRKIKNVIENFSKKAEEELERAEAEELQKAKVEEKLEKTEVGEKLEKVEIKEKLEKAEAQKEETVKEELEVKDRETKAPAKTETKEEAKDSFESAVEEIKKDLREKAAEIQEEEKRKQLGFIVRVKSTFHREEKPGEEKKGILGKIAGVVTTTRISADKFNNLFEEMEFALLENNVALEVIYKIKDELKDKIVDKPLKRGKVKGIVSKSLKESIENLFDVHKIDFLQRVKGKKPYVIMFAGINGSGKTTTIAKLARMFQINNVKCVIAASDTFRAAAIQQLQEHADKLEVKLIKHTYGSDPAAVAFDAIKYAEAKNLDVVLIDTAGRQHSNTNLMAEMKKVVRVAKPDLKIFVGEAITGNDCVEQAKQFDAAIGIDAIILAKADVDEKGGAAISVSYVTKKPIVYLGTGQDYEDLTPFKPEIIVKSLGLAA